MTIINKIEDLEILINNNCNYKYDDNNRFKVKSGCFEIFTPTRRVFDDLFSKTKEFGIFEEIEKDTYKLTKNVYLLKDVFNDLNGLENTRVIAMLGSLRQS